MKKASIFLVFLTILGLAFLAGRGFNHNNGADEKKSAVSGKSLVTTTEAKTETRPPVVATLGPDKDGVREQYLRDIAAGKGIKAVNVRENFSHNNNQN